MDVQKITTSVTAADGSLVAIGQTILIDSEQMYIQNKY